MEAVSAHSECPSQNPFGLTKPRLVNPLSAKHNIMSSVTVSNAGNNLQGNRR
jgi:hypothetical protein